MTAEQFRSICREYDYPEEIIDHLWDSRPDQELTEEEVRNACFKTKQDIPESFGLHKLLTGIRDSLEKNKLSKEEFYKVCQQEGWGITATNGFWESAVEKGGVSEAVLKTILKVMTKRNPHISVLNELLKTVRESKKEESKGYTWRKPKKEQNN